ncbi:TetR/AcrR family transcriptional regulator [Lacticaseibacillus songhuajiangensis]|jgi:AcrR family transcriptional regulator|uniref:TetR/AcrR family transcriptional regulator n=1 Tax=Lacticaseibacillus songhuajiangensis TaxID=1296539 RepID=UPI000F769DE1|nr:TetR/AcrR family transcriptional regulator [Lacticaseibacillus songhuajiangensis]MCI1282973.1 TetR/AcrR family transcriptional regulator [Lacticaseibacillus songhuajiangensis]
MGTEYTRSQQALSRECIQEALFLLMEDQSLDDITISAISTRSGISRMGFYRNYKTKTDVLDDYFEGEMRKVISRITDIKPLTAENLTPVYFNYLYDNRERFALALKRAGDNAFYKPFVTLVGEFFTDNIRRSWFTGPYAEYWKHFVTSGIYAVTTAWIKEGFVTPIPTLVSVTNHLAAQPPRPVPNVAIDSKGSDDDEDDVS